MNNPTENNSNEGSKSLLYKFYKFIAHEIKEKTFGWSLFILALIFMPLWSQVIDSIGNIFIVNISKLDYDMILNNPSLLILKIVLPFITSLFFFFIISLIFFIIRDSGRKEPYFHHYLTNKKNLNTYSFGFNIAFVGKYSKTNEDCLGKEHIYHNILSLAMVANFFYWLFVVLVTLISSRFFTSNSEITELNQVFDVFMNALIIIQCSWLILIYKPYFYIKKLIRINKIIINPYKVIRLSSLIANLIASLFMLILALQVMDMENIKFNSLFSYEDINFISIFVFLIIFSNLFSLLIFKDNKSIFQNNYHESSNSIISLLNFSLFIFLIVLNLLILGSPDIPKIFVSIFVIFITITMTFRLSKNILKNSTIYTSVKRIFIKEKKELIVWGNNQFTLGNVQFVILIIYILIIALMSPNSFLNINVVFPEALYLLLFASSFSLLILFILFYFKNIRLSIFITISIITMLVVRNYFDETTTDIVIRVYYLIFFIICWILYEKTKVKVEWSAFDFFWVNKNKIENDDLEQIDKNNRKRKTIGTMVFLSFLSTSLWVLEQSIPKSLYTSNNEKATKFQPINRDFNNRKYIVVVAAQGGGLAASAWSAKVLEGLDSFSKRNEINFHKNIVAISGVSGGALGAYYYYLSLFSKDCGKKDYDEILPIYAVASRNSLKAILWGMANPMLAASKESALVSRWTQTINVADDDYNKECYKFLESKINSKLKDFVNNTNPDGNIYYIANATVQETGKRAILSNYNFDEDSFYTLPLSEVGDIKGINAVFHAATFPYLTSTKTLLGNKKNDFDYHLADGGYIDNYGIRSALDFILQYSKNKKEKLNVILLQINTFPVIEKAERTNEIKSSFFGPVITLNSIRSNQYQDNNILIKEFRGNKNINIELVEFNYFSEEHEDSEKNNKNKKLPLSWQLLPRHKKAIEDRWDAINSDDEKQKEDNPINILKTHIDCFTNQEKCKPTITSQTKGVEEPKNEIKTLLESIKKDTELLLNRPPELTISVRTNSDKSNFSSIIQCNSDVYLSSKIFIKGEPKNENEYSNGYQKYFIDCKNCKDNFLKNTLKGNDNQDVNTILEEYKNNTTWHILGMTSSKGSFHYNAKLAERRIYLYKTALKKHYGESNSISFIEHPLGEMMSSMDKSQTEDSRRRVYLIPCRNNKEEKHHES